MKIADLKNNENFTFLNEANLDADVSSCFIGDLLSWVMAKGQPNDIWVTVQAHENVVAVALLREFSAIVICDGSPASEETIVKCKEEGINLITSKLNAFEVSKVIADLL